MADKREKKPKLNKDGTVNKRHLTKAEREKLDREEELAEAQSDNKDGFVKEEGEPKPLYTNPEPDYFADPGMVTPPAREPNPDADMSEARKHHGHVEYIKRGDEADSPVEDGVVDDTVTPVDTTVPLPDGESGQR